MPAFDAIEADTKHAGIAFLTWVAEQVGDEARFMHQGMTSSDVLDTCLAVQLTRAADLLIEDLDERHGDIKRTAKEHNLTPHRRRRHANHVQPRTLHPTAAERTEHTCGPQSRSAQPRARAEFSSRPGRSEAGAGQIPRIRSARGDPRGARVDPRGRERRHGDAPRRYPDTDIRISANA